MTKMLQTTKLERRDRPALLQHTKGRKLLRVRPKVATAAVLHVLIWPLSGRPLRYLVPSCPTDQQLVPRNMVISTTGCRRGCCPENRRAREHVRLQNARPRRCYAWRPKTSWILNLRHPTLPSPAAHLIRIPSVNHPLRRAVDRTHPLLESDVHEPGDSLFSRNLTPQGEKSVEKLSRSAKTAGGS